MGALVSVIIPTRGNRPDFLGQAVRSALEGFPNGQIEVIVVLNGSSMHAESVRASLPAGCHLLSIQRSHACAARNAGLHEATAPLIRFLDDDDYLDPRGSRAQIDAVLGGALDVCTGAVAFVSEDGRRLDRYVPGDSGDLVCELFQQRPSTLPVATVFRRAVLEGMLWNEGIDYLQDVDWMHRLMRRAELRWACVPETVGYWRHHVGERLSVVGSRRSPHRALKAATEIIEQSIDSLENSGRMTAARRSAAAKALWDYCHQGFAYSPPYWHRVAVKARTLDPRSRPTNRLMQWKALRYVNPVLSEWLLYAPRATVRVLPRLAPRAKRDDE